MALARWWGLKEPFVRLVLAAHQDELPDDTDDLKTLLLDEAKGCGVVLTPLGMTDLFDTPDELLRLMDGDSS